MRTIAVANAKGGVGKTTSAVNLAACLAERGIDCLVIDLDPQRNATRWLGAETGAPDLLDLFAGTAELGDLVQSSSAPGVDIVPATPRLVDVEARVKNPALAVPALRRALERSGGPWGVVLLDAPPTLGLPVMAALAAADAVLVPTELTVLAMQGLGDMLDTIGDVREAFGRSLPVLGIVACRVKAQTLLARGLLDGLQAEFGDAVFGTYVRDTIRLAEAPHARLPVTLYDPDGHGAADYRALAGEVLERLEGLPR